jgi:hypothetical protein
MSRRSLVDLLGFLGELHAKQVDLYLHQQGLDTSTPAGRAMFQMLGLIAEFERSMIRDRVVCGMVPPGPLARRVAGRSADRVLQRPPKTPSAGCWALARASAPSTGARRITALAQ